MLLLLITVSVFASGLSLPRFKRQTGTSACDCGINGLCYRSRCLCHSGYSGPECKTCTKCIGNPCASSPCLNAGTCTKQGDGFTCKCAGGYTGLTCDSNGTPRTAKAAPATGNCGPNGMYFNGKCLCKSGYRGVSCEICNNCPSPCASNPCANGSTCTISGSNYTCICARDFTGLQCETSLPPNKCNGDPCKNGGSCKGDETTFSCTCPPLFVGTLCQIPIPANACASKPCLNGASCYRTIDSYSCTCVDGYTGVTCDIAP